jgi:hypothetical protein
MLLPGKVGVAGGGVNSTGRLHRQNNLPRKRLADVESLGGFR